MRTNVFGLSKRGGDPKREHKASEGQCVSKMRIHMTDSNHKIRQDPPEDLSAHKDQSKVG